MRKILVICTTVLLFGAVSPVFAGECPIELNEDGRFAIGFGYEPDEIETEIGRFGFVSMTANKLYGGTSCKKGSARFRMPGPDGFRVVLTIPPGTSLKKLRDSAYELLGISASLEKLISP